MEEQYEMIEAYLNDELPAAQRAEVEANAALRAEIDLHRRLGESFADPGVLELRQTLRQIQAETAAGAPAPSAPTARAGSWWWWLVGAAVLGTAAWLLATFLAPAAPPAENGPTTTEQVYALNPELEKILGPAPETPYEFDVTVTLVTGPDGELLAEGALLGPELEPEATFLLQLYPGAPAAYPGSPVFSRAFTPLGLPDEEVIAFGARQEYAVALLETISLPDGRYYFVIRRAEGTPPLFVGKTETE